MSQRENRFSALRILLIGILLLLLTACQPGNGPAGQAEGAANPATETSPAPTQTEPAPEPTAVPPTETPPIPANPRVYTIIPEESETRFYIDELLFGNPKTVIGRTQDLNGEILLDMAVPAAAEIGVIQVNALDLTTDDSFRNRALRRQILESSKEEFQYILFAPLNITGLPDKVMIGEPVAISVTGELTIRAITSPVTFDLTVTPISEDELMGSGTALVLRETFGLEIPEVTGVAQVSQEVRLEIDFVARAE